MNLADLEALESSEYHYRALTQAALRRLIPAMQDFDRAEALLHKEDPRIALLFTNLHFQRAIIFYMNDKQPEAEQACGKALDYDRGSAIESMCSRMNAAAVHSHVAAAGPATGNDGSGQADIRREIDAIALGGQYAPLPEANRALLNRPTSGAAVRIVRNGTAYGLHLLMSGPVDQRIDLAPGGSTSIDLRLGLTV